ncbi:MAG: hypothetical protein ACTSYB_04075 [Candidatus Helarchaeota archaeon]
MRLIRENEDLSFNAFNLTAKGIKPGFSRIELAKINFQNYIQKNYDELKSITKEIPKLLFHLLYYHYYFPSRNNGLIHHVRYEIHPRICRHFDHEQFVNFLFPRKKDDSLEKFYEYDMQILKKLWELRLIYPVQLSRPSESIPYGYFAFSERSIPP